MRRSSQAAVRSDSDAAAPRQIQTDNDASGNPQLVKKCPDRGLRRGRSLTSQTAFGGQLPYKGSLGRPAVIFDHSLFRMMVSFYEPRTTSYGFFHGDIRNGSMRHGFANCGLRACEWRFLQTAFYGIPTTGRLIRTSPTISHTGDGNGMMFDVIALNLKPATNN